MVMQPVLHIYNKYIHATCITWYSIKISYSYKPQ